MSEIVHACPEDGEGFTGCCGRTPFELDPRSRMTVDPTLVTCGGDAVTGPAVPSDEELREVAARAMFDSDYDGTDFHWEDLTDGPDAGRNYYRRHADALLPVVRRWADQRAAAELRESARLLGHVPLSEREQLRKGERMQVSDYTAGMHAASDILAARADALTREATT